MSRLTLCRRNNLAFSPTRRAARTISSQLLKRACKPRSWAICAGCAAIL